MQIVIEELFLFNIIDEDEWKKLNEFRKKRNDLFYFSRSEEKRKISPKQSEEAVWMARRLLYMKIFKKTGKQTFQTSRFYHAQKKN